MANAEANFNFTEDGGSFSKTECQGITPKKFVIANMDITGDYQEGGVDVSKIASYFSQFLGIVPVTMGGYIYEGDVANEKVKVMVPAQAHTHAVTLDGGATNYPARSSINAFLATPTASTTKYFGPGGAEADSAAEALAFIISADGFIRNLYADLATAPGAGKTFTVTLNKNGADQALTLSITETNKTGNDTTAENAFAVSAGDRIVIKTVNDDGAAAGLSVGFAYEITDGAIGILTTDAASASGGESGAAVELAVGTTLELTNIPIIAFGV